MKLNLPRAALLLLLFLAFHNFADAQKRRPVPTNRNAAPAAKRVAETPGAAVVLDETLSVLRSKPSLYAEPIQRLRRGRRVQIVGSAESDGVKFFRIAAPASKPGWVQADAVFTRSRPADEARLAALVQASNGFERIELAAEFLGLYPESPLRPTILLLFGDIIEETALKLSRDAINRLDRREMAASAAPMHSYFLNFVGLDRYRKLGIRFLFNPATRRFHYDGSSWGEIVKKHPAAAEAAEARSRLEALEEKLKAKGQ